MRDPIFEEEQRHLTRTYEQLLAMEQSLSARAGNLAQKVPQEKQKIREDLTLNFDSGTDSMETYIEFEVMNHVIDQYNIESETIAEQLSRVRRLLKAPYFARVSLLFDGESEAEDYYIGSAAAAENGVRHLVIDWRSPIAETYYNQENGRTSYEADGRRIEVDLKLRRQFTLERDRLLSYFDTQIAIEDPLLLASLSESRTDKMQAITATIQREQNEVIRYPDARALLVNGIAGSGKTSVLMQRIAYLFFRQRRSLRPDQVYLMTLNPLFRRYIDEVLPDLGEQNPNILTYREFLDSAGVPGPLKTDRAEDAARTEHPDAAQEARTLRMIDENLPHLVLEQEDFLPVCQKDVQVLSARQIATAARQFDQIPTGVRLIQILLDELEERARVILKRRLREENAEQGTDAGAGDPGAVQEGAGRREERTGRREENRIRNDFGGAFSQIRSCAWLNIDRIGEKLLNRPELTRTEWFYLKMALTGECDRNARYVMVDEVQDYSLAQMMLLKRYFPNARFMLLGDAFQAIRPGRVRFAELHELFADKGIRELPMLTSYRSSPEITELFTGLLPAEQKVLVSSVQRPGRVPELYLAAGRREYAALLRACAAGRKGDSPSDGRSDSRNDVRETVRQEGGLTAVICADKESLQNVRQILDREAQENEGFSFTVLKSSSHLPESGTVLLELSLAKGLEFDRVIIPDADADHYGADTLSRHRLYTAISRAVREITLLACKNAAPLLSERFTSVP